MGGWKDGRSPHPLVASYHHTTTFSVTRPSWCHFEVIAAAERGIAYPQAISFSLLSLLLHSPLMRLLHGCAMMSRA